MTELFPSYFACFPCNTQSIPSSNSLRLTKKSLTPVHIANFKTRPSIKSPAEMTGDLKRRLILFCAEPL